MWDGRARASSIGKNPNAAKEMKQPLNLGHQCFYKHSQRKNQAISSSRANFEAITGNGKLDLLEDTLTVTVTIFYNSTMQAQGP